MIHYRISKGFDIYVHMHHMQLYNPGDTQCIRLKNEVTLHNMEYTNICIMPISDKGNIMMSVSLTNMVSCIIHVVRGVSASKSTITSMTKSSHNTEHEKRLDYHDA